MLLVVNSKQLDCAQLNHVWWRVVCWADVIKLNSYGVCPRILAITTQHLHPFDPRNSLLLETI